MHYPTRLNLFFFVFLLTTIISVHALAQTAAPDSTVQPDRPRSKPLFGLKFGGMMGGTVDIENVDTLSSFEFTRELDSGPSLGLSFEFSSPVWTTAGISLDFHHIAPKGSDDSKWMIDIGVVIKSSMREPGQRFALRPLIGISYGYIPALEGVTESASFMVAKLGGEMVYFPSSARFGLSIEACLIASPFGRSFSADGDDRYDIAARPRPLLRAGIVFR